MSIIEKAVGKIENKASPGTVDGGMDDRRADSTAKDTVQKVVNGVAVDEQPTPHGEEVQIESPETIPAPADPVSAGLINIPIAEMQAMGMLTPAVPGSVIAEEYRTIKRPLLKNIAGQSAIPLKNSNLIMVASALQGDGKTFSSINLAMSIAMEQDKTVLFVDADTSKGDAGRLLGVPENSLGLIDILESKGVGVEDTILRTNIDKLRIIPAGKVHAHANELLASESMRQLMLELSHRYSDRVVVFDSPPLLLTTEAGVLASFMGQIVFVVAADETPQRAVEEALEHVGRDQMVGMVLNRARKRGRLYGYGYSYGYGYGNQYRDPVEGA